VCVCVCVFVGMLCMCVCLHVVYLCVCVCNDVAEVPDNWIRFVVILVFIGWES
jgi:hypothetical protein